MGGGDACFVYRECCDGGVGDGEDWERGRGGTWGFWYTGLVVGWSESS